MKFHAEIFMLAVFCALSEMKTTNTVWTRIHGMTRYFKKEPPIPILIE